MSNVVQFLEALARNPMPMTADEYATVVARVEMDSVAQKALLTRDADALNKALGGRIKMMCMVVPAENDEPQDDEEQDDGESPQREESSIAA